MQEQSQALYLNSSTPMRAMAEAASRIPRMRVGIDMMLLQETDLRDEKGVKKRVQEALDEDIPGMRQAMQEAVNAQVNPQRRLQAEALLSQFELMLRNELMPMLNALDTGDSSRAQKIYREQYAPSYNLMRKGANELLDALLLQAQEQNQSSSASYTAGRNRQLLIIVLGLLISSITAWLIIANLRTRIRLLHDKLAEASAHLSLDMRIDQEGKDEISYISRSFNDFIEIIHRSMLQISNNSQQLSAMANEVTARSESTQGNCSAQNERTMLVATAVHQLNSTVNEIAGNAGTAALIAREASEYATDGHKVVEQARHQVETLNSELERISGVVGDLDDQIVAISSTLDTIRSLSEQTNLLALNAAIEAARAGEHGLGFAVVADEVRTLAGRSRNSTEEIQHIINRLQSDSRAAVEAMAKGREQSEAVVDSANKVALVLEQINEHITQLSDQNTQVATATEEQSAVVEDINRNIEQINQLTQETASTADHLHQSSSHLQELSGHLNGQVGHFRL